jgi:carbon starvation protein
MLAAMALTFCTVVLFKMKRQRFAWVTAVPMVWVVACTVTAGLRKVFDPDPSIGFLSHALEFGNAVAANQVLAPAKTLGEMNRIIFNDYVDATLAGLAVTIVVTVVVYALFAIRKALSIPERTEIESGGPHGAGIGGTHG